LGRLERPGDRLAGAFEALTKRSLRREGGLEVAALELGLGAGRVVPGARHIVLAGWLARLVAGRVLELGAELADSFRDPPREFLELALAGGGLSRPAGGLEGALAPLVRSSGTRAGRVGRA